MSPTVARLLVIDNYDSFTWNLVHALHEAGERAGRPLEIGVRRNDACTVAEALAWQPAGIVISPGPDTPAEAGISVPLISAVAGRVPMLGVCLGHQSLAVALGGAVIRAPRVMHGKISSIRHDGRGLFDGLPSPLPVMRYHSLVVDAAAIPAELVVTATSQSAGDDHDQPPLVMGLRHRSWPVETVQFHPESVGTATRPHLVDNALRLLLSGT